ncbi:hypothetical protein K3495_g7736 [Podosphaera aphanis]|nr:hypothetical protein K3495_g7736 [Podosphaera aphanis]
MDGIPASEVCRPTKHNELSESTAVFEKMKTLLKTDDDTSRFVGLALLKASLDNDQLAKDPDRLQTLWESISPRFLDRLLRARAGEKTSTQEARNMADLAVSVIHVFLILLSDSCRAQKRLTDRLAPLLSALVNSSTETSRLILQSLMIIVSQPEGSIKLLSIEDLSPLTELATQEPMALDILQYAWLNAAATSNGADLVRTSIDKLIPNLTKSFQGTDAVTLLNSIANLLPNLDPAILPQKPPWLKPLIHMIQNLVIKKSTLAGRTAYTKLAACLLQIWPEISPAILFSDILESNVDSKPFSYLFAKLLMIDLRSTFPSLLQLLNSPEYVEISQRLAATFEIICSFIGYLVRSLDVATDGEKIIMAPDLLLKLRRDIAETMSLTIEYLRDRWDASVAGASGLHPSARDGSSAASDSTKLSLTWESMKVQVDADPLVFAGIRTLSIGIREDENDKLRCEAAGLMDMWIELYKMGEQAPNDFRYPIALALEGIMATDDGIETFLSNDGWNVLSEDLKKIIFNTHAPQLISTSLLCSEASRGLQIIRVLLAVLDHPHTGTAEEAWMEIVKSITGVKVSETPTPLVVTEFQIATLQLSVAMLTKASGGMTKRYVTSRAPLSGLLRQLKRKVDSLDQTYETSEFMELLDDVSLEMANLR